MCVLGCIGVCLCLGLCRCMSCGGAGVYMSLSLSLSLSSCAAVCCTAEVLVSALEPRPLFGSVLNMRRREMLHEKLGKFSFRAWLHWVD